MPLTPPSTIFSIVNERERESESEREREREMHHTRIYILLYILKTVFYIESIAFANNTDIVSSPNYINYINSANVDDVNFMKQIRIYFSKLHFIHFALPDSAFSLFFFFFFSLFLFSFFFNTICSDC